MKLMLPSWLVVGVLCLIASPRSLSAPETDSRPLFQSLHDSVAGVKGLDLPDVRNFWTRMLRSSAELDKFSNRPVPQDYAQSLNGLSEALTRVVRDKEQPQQKKVAVCEAVAKDLEIKVEFAKSEPNTPFKNITFAATTKDGTQESGGCEVWYVQAAWEDTQRRYLRFPKVSSPTFHDLPPGWYSMWTRRGGKEGARKPVTVERAGTRHDVDLPVP